MPAPMGTCTAISMEMFAFSLNPELYMYYTHCSDDRSLPRETNKGHNIFEKQKWYRKLIVQSNAVSVYKHPRTKSMYRK